MTNSENKWGVVGIAVVSLERLAEANKPIHVILLVGFGITVIALAYLFVHWERWLRKE